MSFCVCVCVYNKTRALKVLVMRRWMKAERESAKTLIRVEDPKRFSRFPSEKRKKKAVREEEEEKTMSTKRTTQTTRTTTLDDDTNENNNSEGG